MRVTLEVAAIAGAAALLSATLTSCTSGHAPAAAPPTGATAVTPAARQPRPATSVQPVARPCRGQDLALDFRGGSRANGDVLASLVVRDVAPTDCQLRGSFTVIPLNSAYRRIHTFFPMNSLTAPDGLVLSARTRDVPSGQQAKDGKVRALLQLKGADRDDPRPPHDTCQAADEVTPAFWRVEFERGTLTTPNRDAGSPGAAANPPDVASLEACLANFSLAALQAL